MNSCASFAIPAARTPVAAIWQTNAKSVSEFICTGRPDEGIPAVCFKLKEGEDPGYTLYDLSERLRLRGWQVPAFTLGGEATIVMRHGSKWTLVEPSVEDQSLPEISQ